MVLPEYQKTQAAAAAAVSPKATPKKRSRKQAESPAPTGTASRRKETPRQARAATPSKKRGRVSPAAAEIAAANAAAAKRASIVRAVEEAQCLAAPVKELLCSTLPGCCEINGEFHSFQERTLKMLGKALNDIQNERTSNFKKAANDLSKIKRQVESFEKEHSDIEASVKEIETDAKEKEAELAQNASFLQPCKTALERAKSDLQSGDAVIGAAAMETEQLRDVRTQMAESAEGMTLTRVQELCSGLVIAPESFDNLTLLEGQVCQRLAALSETMSKAALARVLLVKEFKAAEEALDATTKRHQACAAAVARAQSVRHERLGLLKEKAQALKQHKTTASRTIRAWNAAQKQLADFYKGPSAAFKDIVEEVEQKHGVSILDDHNAMETQVVPSASELAMKNDVQQYCGAPVIDRRQRQAVLRRRSAALPASCYSRLSLMARRSSLVARRLSMDAREKRDDLAETSIKDGVCEDACNRGRKRNSKDADMESDHTQAREEILGAATPSRRPSLSSQC